MRPNDLSTICNPFLVQRCFVNRILQRLSAEQVNRKIGRNRTRSFIYPFRVRGDPFHFAMRYGYGRLNRSNCSASPCFLSRTRNRYVKNHLQLFSCCCTSGSEAPYEQVGTTAFCSQSTFHCWGNGNKVERYSYSFARFTSFMGTSHKCIGA